MQVVAAAAACILLSEQQPAALFGCFQWGCMYHILPVVCAACLIPHPAYLLDAAAAAAAV
jgi:hypothetical protein